MTPAVAATLPPPQVPRIPWWASIADVLEHARDGIGVLDTSLRIVLWNRAASVLTGAPAADMIGCGCTIAGNVLTVDLSHRPRESANATAPYGWQDVRLCALRIMTRAGGRTVPNIVAALIPVRCDEVYSIVHFSPKSVPPRPGGSATDGPPAALTDREREILALLADGKTAKPISSELSLSLPTVRTHIRHILRKLGVHSCLEAAVWFLRDGLTATSGDPGQGAWIEDVAADAGRPASERASLV